MSVSLCCVFWRKADQRSALTLNQFDACVAANNLDVVRVELVYQRARNERGFKVVLTNLSRGGGGDAWMWFYYPVCNDATRRHSSMRVSRGTVQVSQTPPRMSSMSSLTCAYSAKNNPVMIIGFLFRL